MAEKEEKKEAQEPELKAKPAEERRDREEKLGLWSDDPKLQ